MPMLDELGVSLKDFLPKTGARRVAADPGGIQYLISDRPLGALEDYARHHRIPLSAAVRQLRDEVHRALGLEGRVPDSGGPGSPISFASYRWQKHCRGLYQTPIAA